MKVTTVPQTPEFVKGVINLRGYDSMIQLGRKRCFSKS
jgi:chemotaxis signal transduction protein